MEEQKCEKGIEQDVSSNGNNINLYVLGKFYSDLHRAEIKNGWYYNCTALSLKIWDLI